MPKVLLSFHALSGSTNKQHGISTEKLHILIILSRRELESVRVNRLKIELRLTVIYKTYLRRCLLVKNIKTYIVLPLLKVVLFTMVVTLYCNNVLFV